jgi:hypothetical protein
MKKAIGSIACMLTLLLLSSFNPPTYKMAQLKYNGGGDWYGDRTALPNLIKFCNENLHTNFEPQNEVVDGSQKPARLPHRRWLFAHL